jgi:hypothetical protein
MADLDDLIRLVAQAESGGRSFDRQGNLITSPAGAQGMMQVMPATNRDPGFGVKPAADDSEAERIRVGQDYLRAMVNRYGGSVPQALAAYNAGPGRVDAAIQKGGDNWMSLLPQETRNYVPKVVAGLMPKQGMGDRIASAVLPSANAAQPIDPAKVQWESPSTGEPIDASKVRWEDSEATPPTEADVQSRPATLEQRIVASPPMRALRGAKDVVDAGAQMLAHAIPEPVVNAVNAGAQYLNDLPLVGPVTKAVGLTPATPAQLDTSLANDEKAYQAARTATGQSGLDAYRLAGNVAATAPIFAGVPGAAVTLPQRIVAGAAGGTATGLLNPVLEGQYTPEEKLSQARLGAAFGAGGSTLGGLVGRAIAPKAASNPQIQTLLKEGVTPTAGQLLGGTARTIEDKAISVPIVGDAIRAARTRGVEDFNRAALNRAVAPLGEKVTNVGREGMQEVDQIIGNAYDSLLPKLTFRADAKFGRELGKLQQMARSLPDGGKQFNDIVSSQVGSRLTNGFADGQGFKQIESEIGRLATNYRSSAVASERDLGNALGEVQTALREALQRANPKNAPELSKINKAYAQFTRLQRAASMTGADDGIFTPAQFSSAVRASDKTARKNAYAKGTAMMQDLSDAGRSVMNSTIPNSGTADRLFAGLGALSTGLYSPAIPAGLLAGAIPYLPGVSRAAAAAMARRPDAAIKAGGLLEQASPVIGGLLGLAAR